MQSCVNENEFQKPISVFETSMVQDKEGNVYNTIKIGNQWWMQEDLKATKFGDGTLITKITDASTWALTTKPAYMLGTVSFLYNHATVENADAIIPEGWHVATDEDFKKLEMELGMTPSVANQNFWRGDNIGTKLKEDYQKGEWTPYKDIWGDNQSGFKALPCGCILFDGRFCEPNNRNQGYWWTSTKSENGVWFRYLDYKSNDIFRYVVSEKYGMAIRCVKNE
jgi:uncharacterized protein (TIGR02145 family)